jgi:hypothetical protein
MDNLPDTQNESNSAESSSKSEGDDETLDPRVPVCCLKFIFIDFISNLD